MNRKFFEAAKSGNEQVLNEIGGLEGVANEVTPGGNTVLHIAAYHGSLQFVRKLLQLSNTNPEEGMTFLKAKNMEGNTALHEAVLGGSEQVVNALLKFCPDLVNEINQAGETALFKACEGGHANIVEVLCPMTSSEYNKRFDGQTPLHHAVSKLSTDVIKKLLDNKPELATEVDIFNRTPLHMAALYQFPVTMFPCFLRERKKLRLIGKMLIKNDNGLSCYKVDQNKQSALHVAAKEGNATLVKVILNYSSDCLEMVDKDGRNALHLAVNNAVEIFERVGQDLRRIISSVMSERLINCIDNNGQTALDIALKKGSEDPQLYRAIIIYLYEHGAIKKIFDTPSTAIQLRINPSWNPDAISVSAVLIATVAFAAAFTLPGGIDTQEHSPPAPILIDTNVFKLFVIFDTVAFCYSIGSAILLNFAFLVGREADHILTNMSLIALYIALVSLSITFGAAIHLVVASKCLWLAVLVWVMVCFLPLGIRAMSLFGKSYLFTPLEQHIKLVLSGFGLVLALFAPLVAIAIAVFYGIYHPLRRVWKKLHGIKSKAH
ncbi:hypothetical protein SUGI_0425280 [Cryptomeria japonica]|nr:hypothetical protein SUGI_0425280 [Cryptomeria japonica]